MVDPMTLKQLGEWRLEALRRDAQCRRGRCEVHAAIAQMRDRRRDARAAAAVRRAIGGALVHAGLRVMGDQGAQPGRRGTCAAAYSTGVTVGMRRASCSAARSSLIVKASRNGISRSKNTAI